MLFSCIYGNINQFIQNLYASGMRYRKRMAEMNEFFNYHSVPKVLQKRVRTYIDFQFSVTKGIDVEEVNAEVQSYFQAAFKADKKIAKTLKRARRNAE